MNEITTIDTNNYAAMAKAIALAVAMAVCLFL